MGAAHYEQRLKGAARGEAALGGPRHMRGMCAVPGRGCTDRCDPKQLSRDWRKSAARFSLIKGAVPK